MAPAPYEPNVDERDNYYLGFSRRPRLIARTGGDRWSKPLVYSSYYIPNGSRQIEKSLAVVSDPETISKWSRDLDQSLIKALDQYIWTRFFPIRIGLVDPERRRGWRKKIYNLSTVLLIAVEKSSLGWQQGIQIALECRRLLQSYGIDNIEVEICEGSHSRQVACTRLEAQIETQIERGLSQQDKDTNEVVLNMLVPRGSSSGLTFGQTSGIEAVLREPMKNGTSLYTWELLVIPEGEKTAFSRRGDSGSCVFDLEGPVVGILVGSSEEDSDKGNSIRPEDTTGTDGLPRLWKAANPVDVSFVSPIKWVLDNIQGFTGFRPRLS
jgi:hypothetical protein